MKKHILVIDDRRELVDLFKIMLEEEGYEVLTRYTPCRTVQKFEELHPDLVILGVTDDERDFGRETLNMLKSTSIPTLALYREPEYMLQHEREDLESENITLIHTPSDINDVLCLIKRTV